MKGGAVLCPGEITELERKLTELKTWLNEKCYAPNRLDPHDSTGMCRGVEAHLAKCQEVYKRLRR